MTLQTRGQVDARAKGHQPAARAPKDADADSSDETDDQYGVVSVSPSKRGHFGFSLPSGSLPRYERRLCTH